MEKILVVEDSRAVQMAIAGLLEGYELVSARNEQECFNALSSNVFDLIILDVFLDGASGWDICKRLREDNKYLNTPILFLTAARQPKDLLQCFQSGGNDYIAKPFTPEELLVRVQTHLRVKKLSEELTRKKELEAVNALVITYNHEINNALTIALAKVEKIRLNAPSEDIDKLQKALNRISDLVKTIGELKEVKRSSYSNQTQMISIHTPKKVG